MRRRRWVLTVAAAGYLAGCGGGDVASDTADTTAVLEEAPPAPPDPLRVERRRDSFVPPPRPELVTADESPARGPRPVQGRVEIQLDSTRFVPAEYFLISLEGRGGRHDAVTSRTGEFTFRAVAPGRYRLGIAFGKGVPVFRQSVEVPRGRGTFVMRDVHIPSDSLPRRGSV